MDARDGNRVLVPDLRQGHGRQPDRGQGFTIMIQQFADRVRRGAELLDRWQPGWERKISIDRLAMYDCDRCIVAQIYGDFYSGMGQMELLGMSKAAEKHGFSLAGRQPSERHLWNALAAAWRDEIRARLEREASPP
jgi:hypothetical protein